MKTSVLEPPLAITPGMQCQLKGKNDTLFKDGDPQKPHPIWLAHIEESPLPPPPRYSNNTHHILIFSLFPQLLHLTCTFFTQIK